METSRTIYERFDEAYSKELRGLSAVDKLSIPQIQAVTIKAAAEALAGPFEDFVHIEDLYVLAAELHQENEEFNALLEKHFLDRIKN